jgi:hypothetical protein
MTCDILLEKPEPMQPGVPLEIPTPLRKLVKLVRAASRKFPLREENSLMTDPAAEPETVHG